MAQGSVWRWSAPRLAVAVMIGLAGCQSLPVPRAHPAFRAGGDDPTSRPPVGEVAPMPQPVGPEAAVPLPGAATLVAANEPLPPLPPENAGTTPAAPEVVVETQTEPKTENVPDPKPEPKPARPAFDPVLDELIAKAQAYKQEQAHLAGTDSPASNAKAPEPAPEPTNELALLTPDPLGDILNRASEPEPVMNPPVAELKLEPNPAEPSTVPAPLAQVETEGHKPCHSCASESPKPLLVSEQPPGPSRSERAEETVELTATSTADSPASAALAISDLRFCRRVLGFGNFMPLDALACKAGQTVILYCEMTGVNYEAHEQQFRSRIASRVEIIPESSSQPVWSQALGEADDSCTHPRHDYYVNYRFALPRNLVPGSYRIRLTQTDLHTEQTATHAISFAIRP